MAALRVVYAVDDQYALGASVSLRSLTENLSDRSAFPEIVVLTRNVGSENQQRIADSVPEAEVRFVPTPGEWFTGLPSFHYISATAYARLLIPDLLGDDKLTLYLDSDTLVLGDVTKLARALDPHLPLAAVQDPYVCLVSSEYGVQAWQDLGLPADAPYFNSGVLLLNPAVWREMGIAARTLDYLRQYEERCLFIEQEALNAVLCNQWEVLHPSWNIFAARTETRVPIPASAAYKAGRRSPDIVHFVGQRKPWLSLATDRPFHAEFYRYLNRTAWRGWHPDRETADG